MVTLINGFTTDWFSVHCGLKQGCSLSPLLFNVYINDLALKIDALGKGIKIDEETVSILLYADDVVLIAESEADLQSMLDILGIWYKSNLLSINMSKSNIMHFRNPLASQSDVIFSVNQEVLSYTTQYKYLGVVLTEHLDYAITAKIIAQSANRALGLLIAKSKAFGGFQYGPFTKLYESIVCPVISYGAAVWATQSYNCINAVQNRAARYFLNVGKYTPNAAINGDIGWTPMVAKCWKSVLTFWCRCINMDATRMNKKIFCWSNSKSNTQCKNWHFRIGKKLTESGFPVYSNINGSINKSSVLNNVLPFITQTYIDQWVVDVNRDSSRSGTGGNKLRLYKTFKQDFKVETYCTSVFNRSHRGAFAKFRSGTAPTAIETGRYKGLNVMERKCFNCQESVEDEVHVLLHCPQYTSLRNKLFSKAGDIRNDFYSLDDNEKISFILSDPSIVKESAKTCYMILNKRRSLLYI